MDTQSTGPRAAPPTPSTSPPTAMPSNGDASRVWTIVGYILPILFFIPLLGDDKNKPNVRFHANQQLDLLLFWVVTTVVLGAIPFFGWALLPVAYIIGFAFMVMGLMNASQNVQKKLPLIGSIELLK